MMEFQASLYCPHPHFCQQYFWRVSISSLYSTHITSNHFTLHDNTRIIGDTVLLSYSSSSSVSLSFGGVVGRLIKTRCAMNTKASAQVSLYNIISVSVPTTDPTRIHLLHRPLHHQLNQHSSSSVTSLLLGY